MDWFEKLVGFEEQNYDTTRSRLDIVDGRLISKVNGRSFRTGHLEILSLGDLRERGRTSAPKGRLKVSEVTEDVRLAHRDRTNHGALFQVASQFNLLEMADPSVTPEDGVTCYQYDNTQGPACAIAAGAATIYRNYFAPCGNTIGQRAQQQINTLDTFRSQLADAIGLEPDELWTMQNGYALPNKSKLKQISEYLSCLDDSNSDRLRNQVRIGIHWDVEATEAQGPNRPIVSQAFCSAMPVSYSGLDIDLWEKLGLLVLEAAYEATLWASAINSHKSRRVYMTLLGGGAFGNPDNWIYAAIQRSLDIFRDVELDVRINTYKRQ